MVQPQRKKLATQIAAFNVNKGTTKMNDEMREAFCNWLELFREESENRKKNVAKMFED